MFQKQVLLLSLLIQRIFDGSVAIRISENVRINKDIRFTIITTKMLQYFLITKSKFMH